MKHLKLFLSLFIVSIALNSCSVEVIETHHNNPRHIRKTLEAYELWYVDINETRGYGEVPFLQKAFTVSFRGGTLYANNNLVGIGSTGNGFGIDVGYYNTYDNNLEVSHDINGYWDLEVFKINHNKIEIYHRPSNTSYVLYGYQRSTFDYDLVFYDNIHYFLQEYEAWEKVATIGGSANEFDHENFLQFLAGGHNSDYRSSQDAQGTAIHNLYWDYSGQYEVANFRDTNYVKALTLDYDYFGDEYFEVSVINDARIELYHPASGTAYEFVGRHFIQYLKTAEGKQATKEKKRTKTILKDFRVESSKRK
ncbi:MAG: nicotinic acid mononucleotide adenyltransferase [Flavobacteriaceae bacterium]